MSSDVALVLFAVLGLLVTAYSVGYYRGLRHERKVQKRRYERRMMMR